MAPLSAVWAGPERNEHLKGPPLLMARTDGSTPYRLSLHVGDVGHFVILGPTGAGKSVLTTLIGLQFRRYDGARLSWFDFGGSCRAAVLGMGGDFHDLGGVLLGEGARPVGLQPLARVDQEAERIWAAEWLAAILNREGVEITPAVRGHIWSTLASLASAPIHERTISGFVALLASQDLKAAMAPFVLGGPWGGLLDADAEALGDPDVQAFETEGLLGTAAAPAVLAYLFHRIALRLDGRPMLILIDEGWLALDDDNFAAQLRAWLKLVRKKNGSVGFVSQSLADIDQSPAAQAILDLCPTRIFLPNAWALDPQGAAFYRRLGLNDRQIQIIARATPARDYYVRSRLGDRLFELGLGPVALAFCAASAKRDQTAIAALLAQHGEHAFAGAWLRHRGLAWAADLLPSVPVAPAATSPGTSS
jgi:type IV secretion system protein VirB4